MPHYPDPKISPRLFRFGPSFDDLHPPSPSINAAIAVAISRGLPLPIVGGALPEDGRPQTPALSVGAVPTFSLSTGGCARGAGRRSRTPARPRVRIAGDSDGDADESLRRRRHDRPHRRRHGPAINFPSIVEAP
ncbi:hypothetical protein B0H14DRAFT_3870584 [Mycena olivaceomarginata]|nr:hypothetical protein B0H14DRAFT_3870584 [Mycena olivaceomarginata]